MSKVTGSHSLSNIIANKPIIIEKRQNFYKNRFTIAVYNASSVFEGDERVVKDLTNIFANILNAK